MLSITNPRLVNPVKLSLNFLTSLNWSLCLLAKPIRLSTKRDQGGIVIAVFAELAVCCKNGFAGAFITARPQLPRANDHIPRVGRPQAP